MAYRKRKRVGTGYGAAYKRRRTGSSSTGSGRNYKKWAGAAAGGTLGFIANNIPGAVAGARLGYGAGSSSGPKAVTGKRKRYSAGFGGTKRRRYTKSSTRPHKIRGSDATASSFKFGPGVSPAIKKGYKTLVAHKEVATVATTKVGGPTGKQTVTMLNLSYNGTGTSKELLGSMDHQMIQNQLGLASSVSTSTGGGVTDKYQKYAIWSVKAELIFKNVTTVPVDMILYHIVPRTTEWNGPVYEIEPVEAWRGGLDDLSLAQAGVAYSNKGQRTTDHELIGSTPFRSPKFTHFWNVKKVTKITVHPGSIHKHYVTIKPRNLFDPLYALRTVGLATRIMAVTKGPPVHDSSYPDRIATSFGYLDCITNVKYKFSSLAKQIRQYVSFNGQGAITAPETVLEDVDSVAIVDS